MKLNLGSGDKYRKNYVNVDYCGNPDITHDLSSFPWPFESNSVDEIYSEHFLEHVNDYERTIKEIHRILKNGGLLAFRVPHWRSPSAVWHLHKQQFSVRTPWFLCQSVPYQWNGDQLFENGMLEVFVPCPIFHFALVQKFLNKIATKFASRWDTYGLPIVELEFHASKRNVN